MESINNQNNQPVSSIQPSGPAAPERKSSPLILIGAIMVVLLVLGGLGYYLVKFLWTKIQPKEEVKVREEEKGGKVIQPKPAIASQFATYSELPVNISPKVADYKVEKDLNNITNKADFTFSDQAKTLLTKNAFVVIPDSYNLEFYPLYESNRYQFTPNFITTDSMLHNYHLMFDYLLKNLEQEKLASVLKTLNQSMLNDAVEQYKILKGSEWENSAKRVVGFFSVGAKLMDNNLSVPDIVKSEVEKELSLISNHQEIQMSPVMNIGGSSNPLEVLKEDYSQYIPRGHYDKTDLLKAYFKSIMWYGRLTFRFKSEDEIKSAVLITLLLNKAENKKNWQSLYEPINFFVGKTDDINYWQFKEMVEKTYGQTASLSDLSSDKTKLAEVVESVKNLQAPQINSMPVFQANLNPDREKEIKGFRFMGQRFTIDASIFQRLVYREVGDKTKSCQEFKPEETGCLAGARCLPKGLDIPAAMGSKEALDILKGLGETKYACYPENLSKMQSYLSGLKTDNWTQNLYWGWLYSLLSLTTKKGDGYPVFMKNTAWLRKELNTFLGSWTELKHDTILYAKQVYAELGGGPPEQKDDRGYVEPNPYVYGRLASLSKMTSEGLQSRGLLSERNKDSLSKLETLAASLKTISEKELNNESLSKEEYELIKSYGGQIEHFWLEVHKDEAKEPVLDENSAAALVADVATDPNGQVLEEGTGNIFEIYAVISVDGKLRIAKGGVYSYYEFPWPMSDRLTDSKWWQLLKSSKSPKLPEWTKEFMAPPKTTR